MKKKTKNLGECSVEGCPKHSYAKELCYAHYRKLRTYGDPLAGRLVLPPEEKYKRLRATINKNNAEKRIKALTHYSKGNVPECCCCGEQEVKFLSIDHVNGGGNKHRREQNISNLAHWLASKNYPDGYQTLCHNCNMAKGFYGICPHQVVL